MKYDELLAHVRRRGEHATNEEAERVTRAVLAVLGRRLSGGEASDLAAQLPDELTDTLQHSGDPTAFGVEQFLTRVADAIDTSGPEIAKWDVSAVLSTVADSIDGGELNKVLSHLPSGYAELFGHAELA